MINYNPFSLEGKTILVTGASSGIGRATAIECSKMGATVVLTARNEERLNETLSMMEGEGHSIIPADLTEEEQIMELVMAVPQLDGLVFSTGMLDIKPIKFYSSKATNRICNTNVFSAIYLVRDLLKKHKINSKASLVFISSIAAKIVPSKGNGLYSVTKTALEAFMRQCAIELAEYGIRANAIEPGMVDTNMLRVVADVVSESLELRREADEQRYLCKRYGRPEEIAWMAIYLLSDAAAFVNGSTMVIDGGRNLVHE